MASTDYYSTSCSSVESYMDAAATLEIRAERPTFHRRKTSSAHNALMREIIRPWAGLQPTPPGSRAVSFSSWTRFSSSESSTKSSEDMKASVLWAATGTTPDYDPPLLERTYLGVDQDVVCGKPDTRYVREKRHRKQTSSSSTSSWTTATTANSSQVTSEPIAFTKAEIKTSPPNSLLTASVTTRIPVQSEEVKKEPTITEGMCGEFGVEVLSTSNLPDAFDSDDEEEDEGTTHVRSNWAKRGLHLHGVA